VTLVIRITNGATGPTVGAQAYVELADDSSGTNAEVVDRFYQTDLSATGETSWPWYAGPGGAGGDYPYYRVSFVKPTTNAVTAIARGSTLISYP
jgi:hypothetical protein